MEVSSSIHSITTPYPLHTLQNNVLLFIDCMIEATETESPFCSTCTSNQELVIRNLSNYLPEDTDTTYNRKSRELEAFKSDLNERYPPVCDACQINVDRIMKSNDHAVKHHLSNSINKFKTCKNDNDVSRVMGVLLLRGGCFLIVCLAIVINAQEVYGHEVHAKSEFILRMSSLIATVVIVGWNNESSNSNIVINASMIPTISVFKL